VIFEDRRGSGQRPAGQRSRRSVWTTDQSRAPARARSALRCARAGYSHRGARGWTARAIAA